MRIHHDKHHGKYVSNTKELIVGTSLEKESNILNIIKYADENKKISLFNNAAQSYNHAFYWECMNNNMNNKLNNIEKLKNTELLKLIETSFGSFDNFRLKFIDSGVTLFGSGWVWLILNKTTNKLEIIQTLNADTPIKNNNLKPLLVMDVWEHAYYLNYQNIRLNYIQAFVDHLINWDFVIAQYQNVK